MKTLLDIQQAAAALALASLDVTDQHALDGQVVTRSAELKLAAEDYQFFKTQFTNCRENFRNLRNQPTAPERARAAAATTAKPAK